MNEERYNELLGQAYATPTARFKESSPLPAYDSDMVMAGIMNSGALSQINAGAKNSNGVLANITDWVADKFSSPEPVQNAATDNFGGAGGNFDDYNKGFFDNPFYNVPSLSDIKELGEETKEKMLDSEFGTKLYTNYFYGPDDKRELIKKANDYFGIQIGPLTDNKEFMDKVITEVHKMDKLKKVSSMLDADGNLDMTKVVKMYPYLKEIMEKRGTNEAVMAFEHADGLKKINDVYSNEVTRFLGSTWTGAQRGYWAAAKQITNLKAEVGGRNYTAEEQADLARYNQELTALPGYSYSSPGGVVGAAIGSALENAPMIASSQGAKWGTALIASRLGVPLPIAKRIGDAAAVAIMGAQISGSQYEENLSKRDDNGNLMYTPQQAAWLSVAQGVSEGILEQYALNQIFGAVTRKGTAMQIGKVFKDAAGILGGDLAAAAGNAEAKEAARALIKTRLGEILKAGGASMLPELAEEFEQEVSDRVIENIAQIMINGKEADTATINQIMGSALAAGIEAIPAVAGFGILGMGGNVTANTAPMLNARSHMEALMTNKIYKNGVENQHRANIIDGVAANLDNIQELQSKAPDIVKDILDSQNEQYGMKETSVDVLALKQEVGDDVVNEIAEANGISQEELNACLASEPHMLTVSTSSLQQLSAKFDDAKKKALRNNIAKPGAEGLTNKQTADMLDAMREAMKAISGQTDKDTKTSISNFVKSNFTENLQPLAEEILTANIDRPVAEVRGRKKQIQAQIDNILSGTVAQLKQGYGQGVDVVDNKRVSNNAPWAQAFYAENGRWPNAYELEQIAADIVTNTPSKYNLEATAPESEEEQQYNDEIKNTLDGLMAQRDALTDIETVVKDIQPGDIIATAVLSPEARQIYTQQLNALREGNKEVSATARAAAILSARMADRLAEYAREAGQKDATALDFATRVIPNATEDADGSVTFAQKTDGYLYHGGNDKGFTQIPERNGHRFEGFFFSDYEDAKGHGSGVIYRTKLKDADIMGTPDSVDANIIDDGVRKIYADAAEKHNVDIDLIYEAVRSQSIYDFSEEEQLAIYNVLFNRDVEAENFDYGDAAEADWELQNAAAKIAKLNGYKAVALPDEHGVSYLVLPGTEIEAVSDANDPNIYYQNKFSRPAGIIKEAGELYQKAVEKFPEIKEEGVENLVKDAIQTTLDFGENNNESNNLQKRSGRTNAGRKRQRTGALRKGQPRRRLAEKQNKRGKFLGLGITRALVNDGAVSLVGNTIHSPADLAEIAQVLRHPGYEKMHYVYVDDTGKIVFHETISCMLPAESAIFSKEIQADKRGIPTAFGEHVLHTFAKYKAVKQYVIHNHPSGDNSPSNADLGVTKFLAQNPDFGGHIILDHNKYTLIDRKGNVSEHTLPTGEIFSYDIPSVENPALGVRISTKSIGQYAAIVAKEAATSVFFTDAKLKIRAVQKLHDDFALVSPEKQLRYLRYCARVCGGDKAILITSDKQLFNSYTELLKSYDHDNGIVDAVYADENGVYDTAFESNVLGREGNKWFGVDETKYAKAPVRLLQNSRGSYSPAENVIRLFDIADQSTFMHESSHAYLTYLQQLAEQFPDSQAAKDYNAIMTWAAWQEGQAREYAGSKSAAEFMRREAEIQAALRDGFVERTIEVNEEKRTVRLTADQVKAEWAQERFARAFEEYLRKGEPPAPGLQRVFRRFKEWLTKIYGLVTGAGVRATPEVEAVMARMVATDAEIETAAMLKNASRINRVNPDLMDSDTAAMMERWETEAKEQAKEKLLKELIAEYEAADIEAYLKEFRDGITENFKNLKCYQAEAVADARGEQAVVDMGYYPSVEAWKEDREQYGGPLQQAIDKAVAEEREAYKTRMPGGEELARRAEEAILSGEYNERLTALEQAILDRRRDKYAKAPAQLIKAFEDAENAKDDTELNKALLALKYATQWEKEQSQEIADLIKLAKELQTESKQNAAAASEAGQQNAAQTEEIAKLEKKKEKMRAELIKRIQALKQKTALNTQWLRAVRDASKGIYKAQREAARQRLETMPVSSAIKTRYYINQAHKAAQESANLIVKASRAKDEAERNRLYDEARKAKQQQSFYEAMARESLKLKKELQKTERNFDRKTSAMTKDKDHKIDIKHKYYIGHLLYVFGYRKYDMIRPNNLDDFNDFMKILQANLDDPDGEYVPPDWLMSAVIGDKQVKKYTDISIDELRDLNAFINFLYTTGKHSKKLMTTGEEIAEVVKYLSSDWMRSTAAAGSEENPIAKQMVQLLKPELMLKVLGGRNGSWIKYFYKPLFEAMDKKRQMQEAEAEAIVNLYNQFYTVKERQKMVDDKVIDFKGEELTKENILAMALNWGNKGNRGRLVAGFNRDNRYHITESNIEMEIFQKYMTEKDWQFVQAIWNHIGQYGDEVNKVVEKCTGNSMKRVEPDSFTIQTADGKTVSLKGGYYPVKYDPEKSTRQIENDITTAGQAVGGASAYGTGMGSTKARNARVPDIGGLLLNLDVINNHINQQIHIIAMRVACRDVSKLLNDKSVKSMIAQTLGNESYIQLKEWCENTWAEPRRDRIAVLSVLARLRSKTVAAIMGYRLSTALLNFANVAPMADKIGAVNTATAMVHYIMHPQATRRFVLADSSFMRDRAHNIDRDLNKQQENLFGGQDTIKYKIDKYANWLIEETDMLCSIPLYYWQYQQSFNAAKAEGKNDADAAKEAHFDAHEAVRDVFGSADIIDQSQIQRTKNEMVKLITPFFSFFNAQMNAVWLKYYEGKYAGKVVAQEQADGTTKFVPVRGTFVARYSAFAHSWIMRFVIMAAIETVIRQAMNSASGGDDKDKDKWYKKFAKEFAKNSMDSALGGFPIIRDISSAAMQYAFGGKYQSRSVGVVEAAFERYTEPFITLNKTIQGKKDLIDLGRSITRAADSWYGIPDTLTDAIWNTARFVADNYRFNNPNDLREYIGKTLLDKKLKGKNQK